MTQLTQPPESGRPPQQVRPGLWLFAPSRDSQGGSSWLLEAAAYGGGGDLLVDCPGFTEANLAMLRQRTELVGPGRLVLTSREGHGRCRRWQEALALQNALRMGSLDQPCQGTEASGDSLVDLIAAPSSDAYTAVIASDLRRLLAQG